MSLESSLQLRQRTLPDEFLRYDPFAQVLGEIQEDATPTMPGGVDVNERVDVNVFNSGYFEYL